MRTKKINKTIHVARAAGGSVLILHGIYLCPIGWNGKQIMQQGHVSRNISTPLILSIDGIDNLGIAYFSKKKSFIFQDEINHD
jgi:hypothetical protein